MNRIVEYADTENSNVHMVSSVSPYIEYVMVGAIAMTNQMNTNVHNAVGMLCGFMTNLYAHPPINFAMVS